MIEPKPDTTPAPKSDTKPATRPANNVFSMAAAAISKTFSEVPRESDFSRLRVASVSADGSRLHHMGEAAGAPGVYPLAGTNYLGASLWPETKQIAKDAIDALGVGSFGTCPLSGESHFHEELKAELVRIYRPNGGARAFITASASLANVTAIPMFVGHGDYLFFEEENHMTLVQGANLSRAQVIRYKHSDLADLESKLKTADTEDPNRVKRRLIVTDGIFSMSGHVCRLPELATLAKSYGSLLMLDESHALGAVGKHGRGTHEHWGVDGALIDIVTGTLGKSVGASGGYVVASDRVADECSLEYMTNRAFSSVIPSVIAAAAGNVVRQINEASLGANNTYAKVYAHQRRNAEILKRHLGALREFGYETEPAVCPAFVQRLVIGDSARAFRIQKRLYDAGVYVLAYVFPIVHQGRDMMRITPMATIAEEDMERIGQTIFDVCRLEGAARTA